ncbi:MAG: VWA domain-containing protein [Thermodesulfobacteriota bacterium]
MSLSLLQPWFLLALLALPLIGIGFRRKSSLGFSAKGKGLFWGLRSTSLLLLILALGDLRMLIPSDRVNLFYLLDVSESISPRGQALARNFLKQTISEMKKEDRAGLILFGHDASVETGLKNDFNLVPFRSKINTQATNIRDALHLAAGLFPRSGQNRIVLFSDGNENRKEALEGGNLSKSLGVKIFPVPLPSWFRGQEVFIEKLESPESTAPQTPFDVRIFLNSTYAGQGELILFKNNRLLFNEEVSFRPGKDLYRFQDEITRGGLTRYSVHFNTSKDGISQNNRGISFTQGIPKPSVLYLTTPGEKNPHLKEALVKQGIRVVEKEPAELSESLFDLLDFNAIILHNVSSRHFSYVTLENLERYVKDLGGGLVMVGGVNGFGAGGYLNTPVEKALPVSMDIPTTMDFSGFALVLLIDKSSSMAGDLERKNKMEGAKMAAFGAVEMLNPLDRVGILVFDRDPQWLVPMTVASERKKIAGLLSTIKESGGTDLFPALKEASRVLQALSAAKKHIIILSDGLTQEADFAPLVRDLRESNVTVSTVALGKDADKVLLNTIARWGNGRSYYTEDVDKIPRIFVGETQLAAKKTVIEKILKPEALTDSEIIRGIPIRELPSIQGQVITYPKSGALHLLRTGEGPLLSAWQYGLGRTVAFTSDLALRWGRAWIQWEHFGAFVSQMVKWARRKEASANHQINWERKNGKTAFVLDISDERGNLINFLNLKSKILFPSGQSEAVSVKQTAPGRYQGSFPSEEVGEYYLSLFPGSSAPGPSAPKIFGYGVPYSDEFLEAGVNRNLLADLAAITQGRLLDVHTPPKGLFQAEGGAAEISPPLWPWLILIAMLLLVAEVGVRKLYRMGYWRDKKL